MAEFDEDQDSQISFEGDYIVVINMLSSFTEWVNKFKTIQCPDEV